MQTSVTDITREQVEARERLTRAAVDNIISILSLQPDTSPVHQVEPFGDGLRVPIKLPKLPISSHETDTVYVYALPWSRGWSVFVTPDTNAGPYSWRDVPRAYQGLGGGLYGPDNRTGPWRVPPHRVAASILYAVDRLDRLAKARIARQRKRVWYWPSTALAKESAA